MASESVEGALEKLRDLGSFFRKKPAAALVGVLLLAIAAALLLPPPESFVWVRFGDPPRQRVQYTRTGQSGQFEGDLVGMYYIWPAYVPGCCCCGHAAVVLRRGNTYFHYQVRPEDRRP